jgi:ABC-type transport system involved in cytochrome c biogenesis permease subunit
MINSVDFLPAATGLWLMVSSGKFHLRITISSLMLWFFLHWHYMGLPPLTGLSGPVILFAYIILLITPQTYRAISNPVCSLILLSATPGLVNHPPRTGTALPGSWLIAHVVPTIAGIALLAVAFLRGVHLLLKADMPFKAFGLAGAATAGAWFGALAGRAVWLATGQPQVLTWAGAVAGSMGVSLTLTVFLAARGRGKFIDSEAIRSGQSIEKCIFAGWFLYGLGGIVIGAAWASGAWGRAWSWDPKETLALATFIYYAICLVLLKIWNSAKPEWAATVAVAGFVLTTATWFGVNLLTATHHSY